MTVIIPGMGIDHERVPIQPQNVRQLEDFSAILFSVKRIYIVNSVAMMQRNL